MKKAKVYFYSIENINKKTIAKASLQLLKRLIEEEKIVLERVLPIKVHVGEPGNTSYIKPDNYDLIIDFLQKKGIDVYFVETTTVTGERNNEEKHKKVAKDHGFDKIPFVIADGKIGEDYIEISLPKKTKHFKKAKIAKGFIDKKQVLVISHFKGHIDTGFGGTIKNLGIGFASRIGKIEQHSRFYTPSQKTINWSDWEKQYHKEPFEERVAEYALAASFGKKHLYLNYALNIVENCDCDSMPMKPIYSDVGIFASLDPVAIDKACFDILEKKINKKPFFGDEIFNYSKKIGLGNDLYEVISL